MPGPIFLDTFQKWILHFCQNIRTINQVITWVLPAWKKSYEDVLCGKKGYNIFIRDSRNRIRSSFENGKYDVEAVPGKDLISSIDGELQQYGELLMQIKLEALSQ